MLIPIFNLQLNSFINSDEYQTKCKIIQHNKDGSNSVTRQTKDKDKHLAAVFMKRFATMDEKEIETSNKQLSKNLCIAIENYMRFCKLDKTISSPAVYRILALWFANKSNEDLYKIIENNIDNIPSYKFITALNQITARLNSTHKNFVNLLKSILIRCVKEHPHQSLYQLYPLVYANMDAGSNSKPNNRIQVAKEIISKAKIKSNSNIIKQLEQVFPGKFVFSLISYGFFNFFFLLIAALIDFANEEIKDNKTASIRLSDKLQRLKHLDAIQCPTIDLPVAIDMKYNITSKSKAISDFKNIFSSSVFEKF